MRALAYMYTYKALAMHSELVKGMFTAAYIRYASKHSTSFPRPGSQETTTIGSSNDSMRREASR